MLFASFVKIGAGKAVLFVWASVELHLHVHDKTVWYFEVKGRLGNVCVLRRVVHFVICLKPEP
jgi:hypothetical protein